MTLDRYSIEREIVGYCVFFFLSALVYTVLPIAFRHGAPFAFFVVARCDIIVLKL